MSRWRSLACLSTEALSLHRIPAGKCDWPLILTNEAATQGSTAAARHNFGDIPARLRMCRRLALTDDRGMHSI